MRDVFKLVFLTAVACLGNAPDAVAAPQILALLETPEPTPLVCAEGVCRAEFSTLCLQKERDIPRPNTAYGPVDAAKIVLVLRLADGGTVRVKGHPGLRFVVPRTYVSATVEIAEAEITRLGASGGGVEIGPLASLIPAPEPDDTLPLNPEEIAKVTGSFRASAYRTVKRQKATVEAARATNRLVNAMRAQPAATHEAQNALWRRIADSLPGGRGTAGAEKAAMIVRACQSFQEKQGMEGFKGCLQFQHDQLMFGINSAYWNGKDAGS